jgi:hypothetical protein
VEEEVDIASQMVWLLDRFCGGFAAGDAAAVTGACDMNPDLMVVTSEQLVLRGGEELAAFLHHYERGSTRYAWAWDRHEASGYGDVGWLLATGTESATTGTTISSHPYRMTMLATRRSGHWSLVQVHGSSPHNSPPAEPPTHATT